MNAPRVLVAIFLFTYIGSAAAQNNSQNNSQTNSSEILNDGATISEPIRIYKNTDLNFGIIIPGSTAGIVHVTGNMGDIALTDPPIAATTTSCVFPGGSGPIQYNGINADASMKAQIASLIVTGEPNTSFSITISGGTSVGVGSKKISVQLDPPCGIGIAPAGNAGILSNEGTRGFTLGGKLSMGANQASGMYTGTFTVLVCYN